MKFKKGEFNFLDWYCNFSNTKGILNNKIQLLGSKDKQEITVVLDIGVTILYTTMKKEIENDFSYVFPVVDFSNLIKGISDENTDIDIDKNAISFNKSKYEFTTFDYEKTDIESYKELVESKEVDFTVEGLDTFSDIKDFVGNPDNGLNNIVIHDSNFITSNKTVHVIYKTDGDTSAYEGFYLKDELVKFVSSLKLSSLSIKKFDESFSFKLNDTVFIFANNDNKIPNLVDAKYKGIYEHPYKVSFNKDDLKSALNRIKIISSKNVNTRIFITFKSNELIIESKDSGYALEKIEATYDKELEDHCVILSTEWLANIMNKIIGNIININCSNSADVKVSKVIKITGEDKNKIFLHALYPNV